MKRRHIAMALVGLAAYVGVFGWLFVTRSHLEHWQLQLTDLIAMYMVEIGCIVLCAGVYRYLTSR